MIDEIYPEVEIMGMHYFPSTALAELDPVAYRCGLSDWADSIYSDVMYSLEHYGEWDGYGITVKKADPD